VLRIQPPLVVTKEQMDCAMDRIEEAIEDFVQGRIPDSVLETIKGW
jgi:4-aminobutyrate aminotransferase